MSKTSLSDVKDQDDINSHARKCIYDADTFHKVDI